MSYRKYVDMSEKLYAKAMEELKEGKYINACEDVWGSVKAITSAILLKETGSVDRPKDVTWRDYLRDVFIKAGLDPGKAEELANFFKEVQAELHGRCFYGWEWDEVEHRPLIERAKYYVELLKELIS